MRHSILGVLLVSVSSTVALAANTCEDYQEYAHTAMGNRQLQLEVVPIAKAVDERTQQIFADAQDTPALNGQGLIIETIGYEGPTAPSEAIDKFRRTTYFTCIREGWTTS
ncbi:hypothetical protein [Vreelandella sp. EE22]